MIFYVQGRMIHPTQGVDHWNQAAMIVPTTARGVDPEATNRNSPHLFGCGKGGPSKIKGASGFKQGHIPLNPDVWTTHI